MAPLFTGLKLGFGRGAAEVVPISATGGTVKNPVMDINIILLHLLVLLWLLWEVI